MTVKLALRLGHLERQVLQLAFNIFTYKFITKPCESNMALTRIKNLSNQKRCHSQFHLAKFSFHFVHLFKAIYSFSI